MVPNKPDPRDVGFYYALAQIGLEMVAPIVIGVLLDVYVGTMPWGIVVGAVLGLVAAFAHLISMLREHDRSASDRKKRDSQ